MGQQLGTYIRKLRRRKAVSIRWVGEQISISPSHLSLIERGQRDMPIDVLYPIVDLLEGDFTCALRFLAADAGVPEEVLARNLPNPDKLFLENSEV